MKVKNFRDKWEKKKYKRKKRQVKRKGITVHANIENQLLVKIMSTYTVMAWLFQVGGWRGVCCQGEWHLRPLPEDDAIVVTSFQTLFVARGLLTLD